MQTCLYPWYKQTVATVNRAHIDDQDVPLHLPGHPVCVHQLAHQLFALIYLVEVELLIVKLLLDGQHALWWPPQPGPLQLGLYQVPQLALHHPLLDVVRVVPEEQRLDMVTHISDQLPEAAFLHKHVPPIKHHLVQLQPANHALVSQLTGAILHYGVLLLHVVVLSATHLCMENSHFLPNSVPADNLRQCT